MRAEISQPFSRRPLLAVLAVALLAPSAPAQNHAKAKLFARADGDDVKVAIEIKIDRDYHLYHGPDKEDLGPPAADGTEVVGAPTAVTMIGAGFEWSAPEFPLPEVEPAAYGPPANVHYGTLVLWLRGKKSEGGDVAALEAELHGLTCDPKGCVPYSETVKSSGAGSDKLFEKFPADLVVGASSEPADAASPPEKTETFAADTDHAHAKLFVRADGDDVKVAVEFTVDKGWHLYHGPTEESMGPGVIGRPTTITPEGDGFVWSEPRFPEPEVIDSFGTKANVHESTFTVFLRGRREGGDPATLKATIGGQTCDASSCQTWDATVASSGPGPDALFQSFPDDLAVGATSATTSSPATGSASTSADPNDVTQLGLWAFLATAVGWGVFSLLMPCTYPMIPITISYFTKQATSRRGSLVPLSLVYGAGIVLIFVLIGISVGPLIVPFATHWVTNLVIGAFFVLFALSLFGVILLQPPQFLMQMSARATQRGGYGGVFLMGATLVVTSFTCTAPFVGSLLAAGARSGNIGRVALGMATFGLTMAIPFVLLALLPARLKQLPKGGDWSHTLKVTLGFVEIAAALKFLSNVDLVLEWHALPRELFLLLWAGTFLLAAFYLFGMLRLSDDKEPVVLTPGTAVDLHRGVSPKRMMSGLFFFFLGLYCMNGAFGNRLDWVMESLSPTYSRPFVRQEGAIIDDWQKALAVAKQENKLVAVNFTGHTCVNCRKMEGAVLPDPEVKKLLAEKFVEVWLHTDGSKKAEFTALELKYLGIRTNPYWIIVDPKTEQMLRRREFTDKPAEFLKFLRGT